MDTPSVAPRSIIHCGEDLGLIRAIKPGGGGRKTYFTNYTLTGFADMVVSSNYTNSLPPNIHTPDQASPLHLPVYLTPLTPSRFPKKPRTAVNTTQSNPIASTLLRMFDLDWRGIEIDSL